MICIDVNKGSRLGNWLFQYATAISLAKGGDVAFWSEDRDLLAAISSCSEVFPAAKFVTNLPAGAEVLRGYRQDPRLFDEKTVRREIVCPESTRKSFYKKWNHLPQRDSLASIHVRRGDYLSLPHRFPFVGKSYLRQCVERTLPLLNGEACFIVCSDDIPWCKGFFSQKNFPNVKFLFSEGGTAATDLFVPTFCKCNICSNSTFSWWGAWLNETPGKRIFLPSMWYGIQNRRSLDWHQFLFDGCEVIPNSQSAVSLASAWVHVVRDFVRDMVK